MAKAKCQPVQFGGKCGEPADRSVERDSSDVPMTTGKPARETRRPPSERTWGGICTDTRANPSTSECHQSTSQLHKPRHSLEPKITRGGG